MSALPPASLPLLRGGLTSPETLAPLALAAVLADMSLSPFTSWPGLRALDRLDGAQAARSVGSMAFAAVIPIVLTHRAVTAKTPRGAVLQLALAGGSYGFVSAFASLVMAMGTVRAGEGLSTWFLTMSVAVQAVVLPTALVGMVFAMGRPGATLDGNHRAALAAGFWLLAVGGPLRWSSFASHWRVDTSLDPQGWSLPLVALGGALIGRGFMADRRLARQLASVRAGGADGWRIDPVDATTPAPLPLYDAPPADPDGVLVDPAGVAVARVYQEGVDDAQRLRRRAIGVVVRIVIAGVLLYVGTLAWIFFQYPGRY